MAIPWGIVTFVVGLFYGWLSPGRQNKGRLFRNGLIIGLALAVILSLIGAVYGMDPLGIGSGFVGIFIAAVVLTLLFIVGTWLGDWIEGATKKKTV